MRSISSGVMSFTGRARVSPLLLRRRQELVDHDESTLQRSQAIRLTATSRTLASVGGDKRGDRAFGAGVHEVRATESWSRARRAHIGGLELLSDVMRVVEGPHL